LDGSTFDNEKDCLDYENQFPGHRLVSVLKEIWESLNNNDLGGFQATVRVNGVEWNTGNLPAYIDDTYIDFDDLAVFITNNCAGVVALLTGSHSVRPKVKAKRISSLQADLPG
jgi:hypothetical protein